MHQSILVYRNHRYFWLALATVGVVVAAYLLHAPMGRPHGGTWLGYTLGTIGALLILNGVFGVYAYSRYPALMTENRRGMTLHAMLAQIAELGVACREAVMEMDDAISATVVNATQASSIGGGLWRQLSGRDPQCPTAAALVKAQQLAGSTTGTQAERYRRLIALLIRQDELLRCARRDVQLKALMDIWLYLHVPLSIALVVALAAHVVAVFYYR